MGILTDIVRQRRGFCRIGFEGADHIHPVQRVQVVKVDQVIVLELGPMHQIADDAGILGDLDPDGISTALTEDRAWVYVQTPQERCTK
jgi:hypothetical protein